MRGRPSELIGCRFGLLTVIERLPLVQSGYKKKARWRCLCDCGNIKDVLETNLKGGSVKSCGCLQERDLVNQRFGRLLVINKIGSNKYNNVIWLCKCDCGNCVEVTSNSLKSGKTRSCGCLKKDLATIRMTKHGFACRATIKTYNAWFNMIERCYNFEGINYHRYGARGIEVCDRWLDKEKGLANFMGDMGESPINTSLDRIDNNGDYTPENCRWATYKEQGNNKETNRNITYNNITLNMKQWANTLGINYSTLRQRLRLGWSIERAFTTPVKAKNKKI